MSNTIVGEGGNNTLTGNSNDNLIYGGSGDDTFDGLGGNDEIYGGSGNDNGYGGVGNDTLYGDTGNDIIWDLDGGNTLYGGDGDDQVNTDHLDSSSTLYGGIGNDTLFADQGNDTVFGDEGADRLTLGSGNDLLYGGDGDDLFSSGGAGRTTAYGGTGNDVFAAGGDFDSIFGGEDSGGGDTDTLDLRGYGPLRILYGSGDNESGIVEFLDDGGDVIGALPFSEIETIIPCFTPGAIIDTRRGAVAVEDLRVGDRVLTRDNGFQTIRWIGSKTLGSATLAATPALRPVCIRSDAFGPGVPSRDMLVSSQHRMLLTGAEVQLHTGETEVLAAAAHLSPLSLRPLPVPHEVTYVHILFDRHEIVRADGCWTESFQPSRRIADAADAAVRDELLAIFPALACSAGPAVIGARRTVRAWEARVIGS
jgi:hypothetical protein